MACLRVLTLILFLPLCLLSGTAVAGNVDWLADPQYGLTEEEIEYYKAHYEQSIKDPESAFRFDSPKDPHVNVGLRLQILQDMEYPFDDFTPEEIAESLFDFLDDHSYEKSQDMLDHVYSKGVLDLKTSYTPFGYIEHPTESDSPMLKHLQEKLSRDSWPSPVISLTDNPDQPDETHALQEKFLKHAPHLDQDQRNWMLSKLVGAYSSSRFKGVHTDDGTYKYIYSRRPTSYLDSPILPEVAAVALEALQDDTTPDVLRERALKGLVFNETYRKEALDAVAKSLLESPQHIDSELVYLYFYEMAYLDPEDRRHLDPKLHETLALELIDPDKGFPEYRPQDQYDHYIYDYLVNTLGLEQVFSILAESIDPSEPSTSKSEKIYEKVWKMSQDLLYTKDIEQSRWAQWKKNYPNFNDFEFKLEILGHLHDSYEQSKSTKALHDILKLNTTGLLTLEEQFRFFVRHQGSEEGDMNFNMLGWNNDEFSKLEVVEPLLEKYLDEITEETLVRVYDTFEAKTPDFVVEALFSAERFPLLIKTLQDLISKGETQTTNLATNFIQTHASRFQVKELLELVGYLAHMKDPEKTTAMARAVLSHIKKDPQKMEQLRQFLEENKEFASRIHHLLSQLLPEYWASIGNALEALNRKPSCSPTDFLGLKSSPLPNSHRLTLGVTRKKTEKPRIAISPVQETKLAKDLRNSIQGLKSKNIFERIVELWTNQCRDRVNEKFDKDEDPDEVARESKLEELHNLMYENMEILILSKYWFRFESSMQNCYEPYCTETLERKIEALKWEIPAVVSSLETRLPDPERDTFPAECRNQDPLTLLDGALNGTF